MRFDKLLAGILLPGMLGFCLPCVGAIVHVDPVDIEIPADFGGVYLDLDTSSMTVPVAGSAAASDS